MHFVNPIHICPPLKFDLCFIVPILSQVQERGNMLFLAGLPTVWINGAAVINLHLK